jgi:hypothetical protein
LFACRTPLFAVRFVQTRATQISPNYPCTILGGFGVFYSWVPSQADDMNRWLTWHFQNFTVEFGQEVELHSIQGEMPNKKYTVEYPKTRNPR